MTDEAAPSWSAEVGAELLASRRRAWGVFWAAAAVAGCEALALVALTPLSRVAPYIVLVDRKTGYAEVLPGIGVTGSPLTGTRAPGFLARYVLARESAEASPELVRQVALWSAPEERRRYLQALRLDARTHGSESLEETTVKAVTVLTPETARVRFTRGPEGTSGGQPDQVAEIAFRRGTSSLLDRLLGPTGLQVTRYAVGEAGGFPGSGQAGARVDSPAHARAPLRLPDTARELP